MTSYEHKSVPDLPEAASPQLRALLDLVIALTGPGTHVLELGSGTGRDAVYLRAHGLMVDCSDATPKLVDHLQSLGLSARRVHLLRGKDYGGPYGAILAVAVLTHFNRSQLKGVLTRSSRSLRPRGLLAFTLIEGEGPKVFDRSLMPRRHRLWSRSEVSLILQDSGFETLSLESDPGGWLGVIARLR